VRRCFLIRNHYGASFITEGIHAHAVGPAAHRRLFIDRVQRHRIRPGRPGRPRPCCGAVLDPQSAPLPPSPACLRSADRCLGRHALPISSELFPTQSSRRRMPVPMRPSQPSQAAMMLLMSECCLQSPWLPESGSIQYLRRFNHQIFKFGQQLR
jgi:hypothetical protein